MGTFHYHNLASAFLTDHDNISLSIVSNSDAGFMPVLYLELLSKLTPQWYFSRQILTEYRHSI